MEEVVKQIIDLLKEKKQTVATMESCTGGGIANTITNVESASNVFKFGAVTYSNIYKIKMGVSDSTISKYSVYSIEVAKEMSYEIAKYTSSNYGIGVTGQLNGGDGRVYISIFSKKSNEYIYDVLEILEGSREEKKNIVLNRTFQMLLNAIK